MKTTSKKYLLPFLRVTLISIWGIFCFSVISSYRAESCSISKNDEIVAVCDESNNSRCGIGFKKGDDLWLVECSGNAYIYTSIDKPVVNPDNPVVNP